MGSMEGEAEESGVGTITVILQKPVLANAKAGFAIDYGRPLALFPTDSACPPSSKFYGTLVVGQLQPTIVVTADVFCHRSQPLLSGVPTFIRKSIGVSK
jgi:hypothetical protein